MISSFFKVIGPIWRNWNFEIWSSDWPIVSSTASLWDWNAVDLCKLQVIHQTLPSPAH